MASNPLSNPREIWIAEVRREGNPEAIEELDRILKFEEEEGTRMPPIVFGRLQQSGVGKWFRENTKAYKTPTILMQWKDSLPAPVALWFFDEFDIRNIDRALYFDFDKSIGEKCLPRELLTTCYAYLYLTGDRPGSDRGTWHQGKRAYEESGLAIKSKRAATILHRLKTTGRIGDDLADEFDVNWCNTFAGRETKEIEPIAFTGAGRARLFKDYCS